jgi:hypothetical protein
MSSQDFNNLNNNNNQISSREYNELINLLASRNKIIEEIRFECNGKSNVPVSKLRRILSD